MVRYWPRELRIVPAPSAADARRGPSMETSCRCLHFKGHRGPRFSRSEPLWHPDGLRGQLRGARSLWGHRWIKGSTLRLLVLLAAATILGTLGGVASASTLRVPSDFPTIQSAIQAAAPDDTILVGPGLYNENLDTLGKRLILIGEAGAQATVVDGGRRGRVLRMSGGGVVEGFTLTRGYLYENSGGGLLIEGEVLAVIRNNIIRNNEVGPPPILVRVGAFTCLRSAMQSLSSMRSGTTMRGSMEGASTITVVSPTASSEIM